MKAFNAPMAGINLRIDTILVSFATYRADFWLQTADV